MGSHIVPKKESTTNAEGILRNIWLEHIPQLVTLHVLYQGEEKRKRKLICFASVRTNYALYLKDLGGTTFLRWLCLKKWESISLNVAKPNDEHFEKKIILHLFHTYKLAIKLGEISASS